MLAATASYKISSELTCELGKPNFPQSVYIQFGVLKVRLSIYFPLSVVVSAVILSGLLTHTESLWLAGWAFNLGASCKGQKP